MEFFEFFSRYVKFQPSVSPQGYTSSTQKMRKRDLPNTGKLSILGLSAAKRNSKHGWSTAKVSLIIMLSKQVIAKQ